MYKIMYIITVSSSAGIHNLIIKKQACNNIIKIYYIIKYYMYKQYIK